MLQKLENFYLGILRVVTILVAGLFLVAVVAFGLRAIGALRSPPESEPPKPHVPAATFKHALMGGDSAVATSDNGGQDVTPSTKTRAEFTRAANALIGLYKKLKPEWEISGEKLAAYYQEVGDSYETKELKDAFATGLETRVHELVADPRFAEWATSHETTEVLGSIVSTFKEEFEKQLQEANAASEAKQVAYLEEKAKSMQALYLAGSAFLAFLLIVFLSIIVRIERNLRPQAQT